MKIDSIDKHVTQLISDISNAVDFQSNDLLKSKVAFQLTKIHLGLMLINRIIKLYSIQEQLEDRVLNEQSIENLSMRELLVMSSYNSKRLDNNYAKMDKILASINLRELEGSLLILAEVAAKERENPETPALDKPDARGESLRTLSLRTLSAISSIQKNQKSIEDRVPVGGDLVEDAVMADSIHRSIDDLTGPSSEDEDDEIDIPD